MFKNNAELKFTIYSSHLHTFAVIQYPIKSEVSIEYSFSVFL